MSDSDHAEKFHQKHTVQPNTSEADVRRFLSRHVMVECIPFRCSMTKKACARRHKKAMQAKPSVLVGNNPLQSAEALRFDTCRRCKEV
jgi:hypothetical protein